jgi:purine-binding chemotaxis protein CheW
MTATMATEQYLTFVLAGETYGLGVDRVREVLEFNAITPLPRTAEYVRGVINVRGSVVPVIDLRLKLGMGRTEKTPQTCVVILDLPSAAGQATVGALVDSVQEVVELDAANIEPPPRMGTVVQTELLKGIGRREEKFVMILETMKVFEGETVARALAESPLGGGTEGHE